MKIRNNQTKKVYDVSRSKWDSLSGKAKKIFTVVDYSDSKEQEIKAEKFERPDSGNKGKRNKKA